MRQAGFSSVPCGQDGPAAWAIAEKWNEAWQNARTGIDKPKPQGDREGFVYFLRVGERVKIGFSTNPFTRAAGLSSGFSEKIDMMVAFRGRMSDERCLHDRFDAYRRSGEWFVAALPITRLMQRSMAFGKLMMDTAEEAKTETKVGTSSENAGFVPTFPKTA